MAKRKEIPPVYQEPEVTGGAPKLIAAVVLYGLALLMGYIVLAVPEAGTAMGSVRSVLTGLCGSLAIMVPAMLVWGGTLLTLSWKEKPVSAWRTVLDGLLFLFLLTAVQLFYVEIIIRDRMTIHSFANFVDKSYGYGFGGGALGALLAWPLYQFMGCTGGFLGVLLLAVISLTATGKAGRFIRWCRQTAQNARHRSEQRFMEQKNEQMFDFVDRPQRSVPRRRMPPPPQRAERFRQEEERYQEPSRQESGRAMARRREAPHREPPARTPRRGEHLDSMYIPDGDRRYVRERTERRDTEEARVEMLERPTGAPKRRVKIQGSETTQLYEEPPDSRAKASAKIPAEEDLFDVRNTAQAPRRPQRAEFKPDTSAAAEELRKIKASDNQISMEEELRIEPDICDVMENDDPPFDIPEKKVPVKRMKRTPVPEIPEEEYNYPPIDLLTEGENLKNVNAREQDMEKARKLEDTLQEFGIASKLTGVAHGPAVTRFELQPAPGVKVSRITSLADDIAMRLAAMSVRIEAPIPGKAAVGVEIPNDKVEMVRLRDVLESNEARNSASKLVVGLGKDNSGRYIVADIAKMPHVLIAGQTGSGKSVCINALITSILFRATPEEVRLILIDPKMVELSIYNEIPHLICPVVTDPKKAASALDWAVAEMSMRYKKFAERGVRDIKGFNRALKAAEPPMPQMVIVIDELADLMMVAPGEVEESICRLAQLARAAGMHLVIATQRPSVNVITGVIKANIPTRIAFSVASQVDSRTMIDHGGAEKLLGNGDMLFVPSGINKPMRVQGAWVSDDEVHQVVSYIKERSEVSYDADMIEQMDNAVRTDAEKEEFSAEYDPKLPEAVEIVVEAGQASVSMLQRRMRVGYARAGRLIDEMEQRGIVSEADGAKPRTVLITREEMNELFEDEP